MAPRPPRPNRPARDARLPRPPRRQRARPLRPRLLLAGAAARRHERRLRGGEGRRRGLDARPRRLVREGWLGGDRQHRRRQRDPHPADAGGEPGQGVPDLHPRGAHRRGDRIPVLRRGRADERQAALAPPLSVSPRVHDFASDNHAGAHPDVLAAVAAANEGHAGSYGDDRWTHRAEEVFRRHFGADARAFCVFNGTAANVLAISALTHPYEAVICPASAHLNVDECGAPERFAGVMLLTVETEHWKLEPADL